MTLIFDFNFRRMSHTCFFALQIAFMFHGVFPVVSTMLDDSLLFLLTSLQVIGTSVVSHFADNWLSVYSVSLPPCLWFFAGYSAHLLRNGDHAFHQGYLYGKKKWQWGHQGNHRCHTRMPNCHTVAPTKMHHKLKNRNHHRKKGPHHMPNNGRRRAINEQSSQRRTKDMVEGKPSTLTTNCRRSETQLKFQSLEMKSTETRDYHPAWLILLGTHHET